MQKGLIPNLSVDCVVFGFDFNNLNILLIERNFFIGDKQFADWKLPGDLIKMDEDLDTAAFRILIENTGVENIYLKQFRSFGSPNRLMRNERDMEWLRQIDHTESRVITIAYYSLVNISHESTSPITLSANARWYPMDEIPDLVMDHIDIVNASLESLRNELMNNPIAFELLPEKFSLSQMQMVYEIILGKTFDKRNFRKKISGMKYLIPLQEKQTGVAHKPARLYKFNREIYLATQKDYFDFSI